MCFSIQPLNIYMYNYAGRQSGGVTPAHILAFVTGAMNIPPMGFPKLLSIMFIEDKSKLLPTASTCSLQLSLPCALSDYSLFTEQFDFAILNTVGFGQV